MATTNDSKSDLDAGVVIETFQKNPPSIPTAWLGTTLFALLLTSLFFISRKARTSNNNKNNNSNTIPLMNPPKFYDLFGIRAKLSFVFGARALLAQGARTGRPFKLLTDLGEMIVLPARYAHEIRNDPRLSFSEVIVQVFSHARIKKSCCRGVHGLIGMPWSRPLCRISTRTFQASKGSARAPRTPISVAMLRITSSRILSVGCWPPCPEPSDALFSNPLLTLTMFQPGSRKRSPKSAQQHYATTFPPQKVSKSKEQPKKKPQFPNPIIRSSSRS